MQENIDYNSEKNNKKKNIFIALIIFVILVLVSFLGYYIYTNVISNKNEDDNMNKTETSNSIDKIQNSDVINDSNTDETNDEINLTYESCIKNYEKLFSKDDYEVYKNNDNKNVEYYVVNNKIKKVTTALKFYTKESDEKVDNYYYFTDYENGDSIVGMLNIKDKILTSGLSDYSCEFHSDVSAYICENSDTIIVKDELYGIMSLKDFSIILKPEYDSIYEVGKYFLVSKNGKNGLVNSDGKYLLNIEYDYLGYNSYIGFIGIKGSEIFVYNEKIEKQNISNTSLLKLYNSAYKKYYNENSAAAEESLFLSIADSYFWTVGSKIQVHNLSKPFDQDEDSYAYKYIGNEYNTDELVINSVCSKNYIYVIEDNKAYKIPDKDIKEGTNTNSCF